ncbi:hypothetical protein [Geochorda subterranea]|uniref:CopG family transcriptional regulator n=1 Tax=Geochorda subterranea TaxID=3109564 RepID=A0ABZ1BR14_9FIRM|nr:hypothetical protein [Limnochorda sp. LNt]WRP15018.1 hypothetical protein VLY81_02250 [Limnochorda sp. LNt]
MYKGKTMATADSACDKPKVTVRLDQLQYRLVEFLRQEGKFGSTDGEIIANVVRFYLQEKGLVPLGKSEEIQRARPQD